MDTLLFGSVLKSAMEAQGLHAAAVARAAGISGANLSRILAGQTNPSFSTVVLLAKVLNVPLEQLAPTGDTPSVAPNSDVFCLKAIYVLENTDHSPESAAKLLTTAAQGNWVNSWTHAYTGENVPQPQVVRAVQVGTRRLELELHFPHDQLEKGSIPGLLSVVSSGLTGTGARLLDVRVPEILLRTFPGPNFGGRGLRDTFNKHGRPLLSCTLRPMHGLSPRLYGRAAYEALVGGVDVTADPTLLHSIPTNPWKERFRFVAEAAAAATRETNEFKTHVVNITAATLEDMQERALWARDLELAMVLVDSAAVGWTALHSISLFCAKHDLLLATMGGRSLAGDMLSEQLQAKLLRLIGADVVSTGSPLRGNVSNRRYVAGVLAALRDDALPASADMGLYMPQTMAGMNGSLPAVGGGHNPWHFPRLVDAVGHEVIIQCGGSVMGHPWGSLSGATACRTALEALVQAKGEGQNLSVEGRSILQKAAKYSPDLKQALDSFQESSFLFGIVSGPSKPTEGSVIPGPSNPSPTLTPTLIMPFKRPEPSDEE